MKRAPDPLRIDIVALPSSTGSALYGLFDVLSSSDDMWSAITGDTTSEKRFSVRIVSHSREPFRCWGGVPVIPEAGFGDNTAADIVLIPDLMMDLHGDPRGRWPETIAWVNRQYELGATLCTVCTGSVLLADTGLLDNKEATTHWGCVNMMRAYHPAVTIRAERLLVPADAEHRIVTAGGASAWEDMALYIIGRFHGQAEAIKAAKVFLIGDHGEGQLPYAAVIKPRQHQDSTIAACQEWIADHYATTNPVARMTERSGLTDRTFKRRFRAATGFTPVEYVQTLRIEEAKQYLESTSLGTDEIGALVGYVDPAFFRRLFKRQSGTTPAAYRQRYAMIGSASAG